MDPVFDQAFQTQIDFLTRASPYREIKALIQTIEQMAGQHLRSDGMLFLLITVAQLIVIPFAIARAGEDLYPNDTLGKAFLGNTALAAMLHADLDEIIREAGNQANQAQVKYISANTLLRVTGTRTVGLRTRGLNIWGP